ncbi:MAG: hypothetical protein J5739_08075 [Lachnospiraceae bacterium]|nr:hypothetical protein [Lachnospiraceae bacterium]
MIESIDNYIQLAILGICSGATLYKAITKQRRSWVLVTLFYVAFFFGSLYWELFYMFKGDTPAKFYVAEFSWYVSYMFLFLFLKYQKDPDTPAPRCRIKWLIPVFAGGLSIYYITFGQIVSNITSAILMSLVGMEAVKGLASGNRRMKRVYIVTLIFFFLEYLLWTSSCLFEDGSVLNPYYYIDILISIVLFVLLLYAQKALRDEVTE